MEKKIGIWLDNRKAFIIELLSAKELFEQIDSQIEEFHPVGGARSKTAWGPMDKVSESKHLERRKQQQQHYFQAIADRAANAKELYLFGPAEAKIGLRSYLLGLKSFRPKIRKTETADVMTKNQMVAKVKEVFRKQ